jgi:hypothetical protein
MNEENPATRPTKDELNQQTATVDWSELVKHFARGVIIYVDADLDLIDVAHHIASDDVQTIEKLLTSGSLRRASDEDARDWNMRSPQFWCVVAAPWVLIQERVYSGDIH